MNLNRWNFDFESLPHWNIREKVPYVHDLLFENPQLDMAFVIYSIVEYRMCSYAGRLAILKNKKKAELVLRVEKGWFTDSAVVFSANGRLAFAISDIWDGGWPIFIFDLSDQKFACFQTVTNTSAFAVKEVKSNEFVIVADEWQMENDASNLLKKLHGTKIETDALEWVPFDDIDSFCAKLVKRRDRSNLYNAIRSFLLGWRSRPAIPATGAEMPEK